MERDELIAALERAEGPSEELDARILSAIYAPDAVVRQSPFNGAWCLYKDGSERLVDGSNIPRRDKNYTSSIDAALTLVPEGWIWGIGTEAEGGPRFRAGLSKHNADGWDDRHGVSCSPAIALCIAALKARAND